MTVKAILKTIAAPGLVDAIPRYDANTDGYLCVKVRGQ